MTHHSPLEAEHLVLGATMTEFAGWPMPLRYASDLAEHRVVREAVGLFDLSHMGEIRITGPEAPAALDAAVVGQMSAIPVGRAKYTMLCAPDGGVIDDLVVYRTAPDEFLVVANAGNAEEVAAELARRCSRPGCVVVDESMDTALIAIQGPLARDALLPLLAEGDASAILSLPYYASAPATVAGHPARVARTGYTGEDGFELFVKRADAEAVWGRALTSCLTCGGAPCGLGARDTLRLEAGMALYGHELSRALTPFSAGLGRVVHQGSADRPRGEFVGAAALASARADREAWDAKPSDAPVAARVLVGLVGDGKRAARAEHEVLRGGEVVGHVTSGAPSPTLGRPIAMAFIHPSCAAPGTDVEVDVRGRHERMTVCALPFYQRAR